MTKVAAAKNLIKNMKNTFSETREIFVAVSVSFKNFDLVIKKIAQQLNLSENTVSSYCRRKELNVYGCKNCEIDY